jgi:NADH pyrophosphatase NudC (nudix superfamily)
MAILKFSNKVLVVTFLSKETIQKQKNMDFFSKFAFCPACGSSLFEKKNEKSKRCASCGFVFYMNPSAAVAAFIVNEKQELLVCRRKKEPAKGTLDLPGGFVDNNETAEEALKREISEELQSEAKNVRYLFSLPNEYEYCDLLVPTLDLFFSCKLPDETSLVPSDDVEESFFVPFSEIRPELFGLKSVKKAIERFLQHPIG